MKRLFWFFWVAILAGFAVLILTSCDTSRRAAIRGAKIQAAQPEVMARLCAQYYPVKEVTTTEIEYIHGRTDTIHNEVMVDCDTVFLNRDIPRVVRVKCPPSTHTTDTVLKSVVSYKENTAKIQAINNELSQCVTDREKASTLAKNRGWWLLALALYLLTKNVLRIMFPALGVFLKRLP